MAKSKTKPMKLPKTIAGWKVPKPLRRSSGSLIRLIDSPLGRQVMANALVAAAGALVANRDARRAVGHGGTEATGTLRSATDAALVAVADGVRSVLPGGQSDTETDRAGEDRPQPARSGTVKVPAQPRSTPTA